MKYLPLFMILTCCGFVHSLADGYAQPTTEQAAPSLAELLPEPLVGDRPDFTESPTTVPPGRVMLETGYTNTRLGENKVHTIGEVLLRYGIVRNWELRIGLNSYTIVKTEGEDDVEGLEDTSLGLKIRFLENKRAVPELACILSTGLPTGSSNFRISRWQPAAVLAAGWDVQSVFSIGVNLGFSSLVVDEERIDQVRGSLALGLPLGDRWSVFGEWFGLSLDREGGSDLHYLDSGVTLLATPDLQFDFRVGYGLNGIDPDDFIGVGAVIRW
jgi:hypothetical protein